MITSKNVLVEEALIRCTICGVEGPKDREREHWATDHRLHDREPGGDKQFIVGVPARFRPRLEAIRAATGATYAKLLAIALDDYYGTQRTGSGRDGA